MHHIISSLQAALTRYLAQMTPPAAGAKARERPCLPRPLVPQARRQPGNLLAAKTSPRQPDTRA